MDSTVTEHESDEYGGLFAVPVLKNDGTLDRVGGVAAKLARPRDDLFLLTEKVRNQVKAGNLPPVGREEGRGHYLFDSTSVVLAAALLRFVELGVSTAPAMNAVSSAATIWTADDLAMFEAGGVEPAKTPIAQLARFHAAGFRKFHVELRSAAPVEGGETIWAARLICASQDQCTGWSRAVENLETRATVLVGIDDVIASLGERQGMAH